MKAGTQETIKFKRLQRRLGLPLWQTVGILESLWQVTARSAPRGDIGKHSNEEIAASMEYAGCEDELVSALVDAGWLDEDDEHRLLVHDWHQHAPNYVKGNVARHLGGFVTDTPQGSLVQTSPGEPGTTLPPNQAKPNQAKPSLTKGGKATPPPADLQFPEGLDLPEFRDAWDAFVGYYPTAPENHSGRPMPFHTQQANLGELARRLPDVGLSGVISDLKLSIRVSKRGNLLDSRDRPGRNGGKPPAGRPGMPVFRKGQ